MALTKTEIITEARKILKDSAGTIWTTESSELEGLCDRVVKEVGKKEPLEKYAILAVVDNTPDIDISALTYLEVISVEHPVGNSGYPVVMRNYKQNGSRLIMDLNGPPTVVATTLTGTITFTKDSRTVTAVGGAFLSELSSGVNGDCIALSTGTKYYQVAYVTDDNTLTLAEPFEETTATDSANVTKRRANYSCAKVHYGAHYTVSTTTNAPSYMDEALISGVVAHALTAWVNNYAQGKMTDITSKLTSAATAIGNASARITQAITDVGTFRTNLGGDITSFEGTLADVTADLALAEADLVSGRAKIPDINIGGNEGSKYAQSAQVEIQKAEVRLQNALNYAKSSEMSARYIDIVEGELKAAKSYLDQAAQYCNHVSQSVMSNYFVISLGNQAKEKWKIYEDYKKELGKVRSFEVCSREL